MQKEDRLVWLKNLATREFMMKLGYQNLAIEYYQGERKQWWHFVWKNAGSLKDKITLWIALSNKLLTWDNLIKRGWKGPIWCLLCHSNEEIGSHLFVSCHYGELVWKETTKELKSQETHEGTSLEQKCHSWWLDNSVHHFNTFPSSLIVRTLIQPLSTLI